MKRILLGITFALFAALQLILPCNYAAAALESDSVLYGILKDNAMFLNQQKEPVASLPASYFVIILGQEDNHYNISYKNLNGYIDKSHVEEVDYEPVYKLHTAYYTAKNDTFPTNIRTQPRGDSQVAASIPLNQKAYFYGIIDGEELIGGAGTVWYYVEYNGVFGYAYCAHGIADEIAPNVIEKVSTPLNLTPDSDSAMEFEWYYILLAIVPTAVVMFALFSRPKRQTLD